MHFCAACQQSLAFTQTCVHGMLLSSRVHTMQYIRSIRPLRCSLDAKIFCRRLP